MKFDEIKTGYKTKTASLKTNSINFLELGKEGIRTLDSLSTI